MWKISMSSNIKKTVVTTSVFQKRASGARKLVPYMGPILKLFLDILLNTSANNVTTRVAWMFSWRMKTRVKPLGLST